MAGTGAADVLLIDIDGVLVTSWRALPGAVDALARIRSAGVPVRFLTNTTSRTRADIVRRLADAGFDVAEEEILTAAAAALGHLRRHHPGARCLLLNSGDVAADLPGVDLVGDDVPPADVDVVILGGAGPELTYEALNRVLACLLEGATFLAMHRNVLWRTSRGLQLDTGAFVVGLEQASGAEATVVGKPARTMFASALDELHADPRRAAMVGDDLDSDVRAAQALGITGVQVRTGKFREEQLASGPPPDVLLESFADVPGWLGL